LLNEELHGVYSSQEVVKVVKSRMMRYVGYVT